MLYLLPEQTEYLLDLLKQQPSFWVVDKLIEQIEDDIKLKEIQAECEHDYKEYVGKKTCCSKCDAYGVGNGFLWTLKEFLENSEKQTAE